VSAYAVFDANGASNTKCSVLVFGVNPTDQTCGPTAVSAEPFSHRTGTLLCLQKEMATYRHCSVSLWQDPDDVSHCRILSPDKTEWQLISATLCGWRRCFVVHQLWLMIRIQEERRLNLWDVSTTERPSFTMSMMQFHRNRLAFGSIPVVGSSWIQHHN